jgi:hypothetical protein
LRQYKSPVYKFHNQKLFYKNRSAKNGKYRYASWKLGKKNLQNPICFTNGEISLMEAAAIIPSLSKKASSVTLFTEELLAKKMHRKSI